MDVLTEASQAINTMLGKVRALEQQHGVSPQFLDAVKPELISLATRAQLFPTSHFNYDPRTGGGVHLLAEDPDGRFALYVSAGRKGHKQPPHNHTTWACIAGVHGAEHNVVYRRVDDRSRNGWGQLQKVSELTVKRGNAVAYAPDDFHTIEFVGDDAPVHLHLYGLSLERLPQRVFFNADEIAARGEGGYKIFGAPPVLTLRQVPASEVKAMINDGDELAFFDVREEGVFDRGHPLFASSLPLSQLELKVAALCPRRDCRMVLMDEGDGDTLAYRAGRILKRHGYGNVSIMRAGLVGWRAAGFEVFAGVNVPSKAFGEFVEHTYDTPRVKATEVKAWLDAGKNVIILDSRPWEEYTNHSIPSGIDCPGAELVHRAFGIVHSPDTTVVVNCAGRTRSIIGAQSLINAGLPNRVVALENGTMGWHLAGLEQAHGANQYAAPPTPQALAKARTAADQVAQRFGVTTIDIARMRALQGETNRSTYLLDVRTPEEYDAGHIAGSICAPGGQLVQSTDHYVGVRAATLILIDDNGVRARMSASWLLQMGWPHVYVLSDGIAAVAALERGKSTSTILPTLMTDGDGNVGEPAMIDSWVLKQMLDANLASVVDLGQSIHFRRAHVPGAWWAIRSRLASHVKKMSLNDLVVVTSGDAALATLAAPELARLCGRPVRVLRGGTRAWRAAGLPFASGVDRMCDQPEDIWYRPYDQTENIEAAMHQYLTWELDLVKQIERDGDVRFKRS